MGHTTMHIWRTMKRRIADPGDNSFMLAFKDMLGASKLPSIQMALLPFDRPIEDGSRNPKRTLKFLENEVENYIIAERLKINLRGHRNAAAMLCKTGKTAAPAAGDPAAGATGEKSDFKGKDKGGGKKSDGKGYSGRGCFKCGAMDYWASTCPKKYDPATSDRSGVVYSGYKNKGNGKGKDMSNVPCFLPLVGLCRLQSNLDDCTRLHIDPSALTPEYATLFKCWKEVGYARRAAAIRDGRTPQALVAPILPMPASKDAAAKARAAPGPSFEELSSAHHRVLPLLLPFLLGKCANDNCGRMHDPSVRGALAAAKCSGIPPNGPKPKAKPRTRKKSSHR